MKKIKLEKFQTWNYGDRKIMISKIRENGEATAYCYGGDIEEPRTIVGPVKMFEELFVKLGYTLSNPPPLSEMSEEDAAFFNELWPAEPESSKCQHDLKSYVGLTETYKYCTKCPHKDFY